MTALQSLDDEAILGYFQPFYLFASVKHEGLSKVYESVLEEISKSKKPEELSYQGDLISPIDMIEAIVAHHITAPLLRARLETNHEVFYSISKYMEKLSTLPALPVLFEGEDESYADYMKLAPASDACPTQRSLAWIVTTVHLAGRGNSTTAFWAMTFF
jgi:hypothetical protein